VKGHGETILVVEDDVDVREAYVDVLDHAGYRVDAAVHGLDALEYLRSHQPPAMILLDLMMPVMDGWQLHGELAADEALARIPVVVITAHREAPGFACADRLLKPVPLRELLATIARVVTGAGG
jgi:CheY-like chemotaxis protein